MRSSQHSSSRGLWGLLLFLAPPPQLFDLPPQFVYLIFQATTPQLLDLPSQFV